MLSDACYPSPAVIAPPQEVCLPLPAVALGSWGYVRMAATPCESNSAKALPPKGRAGRDRTLSLPASGVVFPMEYLEMESQPKRRTFGRSDASFGPGTSSVSIKTRLGSRGGRQTGWHERSSNAAGALTSRDRVLSPRSELTTTRPSFLISRCDGRAPPGLGKAFDDRRDHLPSTQWPKTASLGMFIRCVEVW
ncbi:hypothetical protein ABIE78_004540 [Sinorhizobium fredii]